MMRLLSVLGILSFFLAFTNKKATIGQRATGHNFTAYSIQSNILYIGVGNIVQVTSCDVVPSDIELTCNNGTMLTGIDGQFILVPTTEGTALVSIKKRGESTATTLEFKVKKLPDPPLFVGANQTSEKMGSALFRAQGGLSSMMQVFEFRAPCEIRGYEIVRLGQDGTRASVTNLGARYSQQSKALIQKAERGDFYIYREIKVKCEWDAMPRTLPARVVHIM